MELNLRKGQSATVAAPSVGGEWSHVKPAGAEGGYNYFFNTSTTPYGKTYGGNSSVEYTDDGFFVMKYRPAQDGNVPVSDTSSQWTELSFNDDSQHSGPSAYTACENLDSQTSEFDVHLMTNREWMTMARQVAQNSTNWADGSFGSNGSTGGLYQGNHQEGGSYDRAVDLGDAANSPSAGGSTQRTHKLPTGDTIWDISGDLYLWVDAEEDGTALTTNSSKLYEKGAKNSTVSNGDGLGADFGFTDGEAIIRSGSYWVGSSDVGVFHARSDDPTSYTTLISFRCSAVPIS